MKSKSSSQLSRRAVFAGVGTAGAVAAVSSALPLVKAQAPVAVAPVLPAPERGGGYTLTEYVQRYYKTARI